MADKPSVEEIVKEGTMEIITDVPKPTSDEPKQAEENIGQEKHEKKSVEPDGKTDVAPTDKTNAKEENQVEDSSDVISAGVEMNELKIAQDESNATNTTKVTETIDDAQEKECVEMEAVDVANTNDEMKTDSVGTETEVIQITSADSSNETATNDSNCKEKAPENAASNGENKDKQPAQKALGSLGLLNQYASSSDEDEDSSSSDDDDDSQDADSESESESDIADDSSNREVLGTPASKDKELNTIANNILNSVMSRENYRDVSSDTSESSDDSDVECLGTLPAQTIDITNDEEIQEFLDACDENAPQGPIKAIGELGIEELPPIAELTITVAESECVELGKISGIVDTLVLVESLAGFAAVDIDTVLFLEKGNRTLGQVFDVMGNVSSPIYCVRFNTAQDIQTKNVSVGQTVYVAPQTEYTNFIVLSDLMKEKGCDASWENDHEAPEGYNDFSDDEEERLMRRQQNQRQRNRNRPSESSDQRPNKVTVKSEPNTTNNRRGRRQKPWTNNRSGEKQPSRFYKDNRGYANANLNGGAYFPNQRMPPAHHNYSWHTAAMSGIPPAATSSMPYPPVYHGAPNHGLAPNMYPNPFAMQANQINGPFNLQAFPPLPPPMSSIPPHHQQQHQHQQPPPANAQYNRKKPNSFQ